MACSVENELSEVDAPMARPVKDEKLENELPELDRALSGPVEDCEFVDAIVVNTLEAKVDTKILELVALVLVRADVSDDAPKVLVLVVRDVSDDA
jgi:hypothetical protein